MYREQSKMQLTPYDPLFRLKLLSHAWVHINMNFARMESESESDIAACQTILAVYITVAQRNQSNRLQRVWCKLHYGGKPFR